MSQVQSRDPRSLAAVPVLRAVQIRGRPCRPKEAPLGDRDSLDPPRGRGLVGYRGTLSENPLGVVPLLQWYQSLPQFS